ncbi:MAG: CPBP family intramembrane metalloprotease [Sedimentisphaerales bacterium]|nr:CPBP family intramembrane metalloprotease [Sedimentisphaerales bacterium]
MLKKDYLFAQPDAVCISPTIESVQLVGNRPSQFDTPLLIETVLITIVATLVIKLLAQGSPFRWTWLLSPGILVAAGTIPTMIKKRKLPDIGFSTGQVLSALKIIGWTSIIILPPVFCGLWLLKLYGFQLPLQAVIPKNQEWIQLILYQFMYVAVAEEVFFRGYVQNNILRLRTTIMPSKRRLQPWTSIVLSAAVFAVAHVIVHGTITSVLTFLPGLIFGWLFIRTKSLLAPILFHGLSNTCYFVMLATLT